MFKQFLCKNFRSIHDEISLDLEASSDSTFEQTNIIHSGKIKLLKTAAIFGPNASGKSNILLALFQFREMVLHSFERSLANKLYYNPFKLSNLTDGIPTCMECTFLIENEIYKYGFEYNTERITSEWLIKENYNVTLFKRSYNKIQEFGEQIIQSHNQFLESTSELKDQTNSRCLHLSLLALNKGELSKKIVNFFENMYISTGFTGSKNIEFTGDLIRNNIGAKYVIQELVQFSDSSIKDLSVQNQKNSSKVEDDFKYITIHYKEYLEDNKKTNIPIIFELSDESLGTQNIFGLAGPIVATLEKGGTLIIDEFDSSIHHQLCHFIIEIFYSSKYNPNNAQLIFTTHDLILMDEKLFRRDQIYFTQKTKNNNTELYSLVELSERKGLSYTKRYLEGRYEALPYFDELEKLQNERLEKENIKTN